MRDALLAVAVLACPVGMGLMMVLMMRGHRGSNESRPAASDAEREVAELRSEVERLKTERTERQAAEGGW